MKKILALFLVFSFVSVAAHSQEDINSVKVISAGEIKNMLEDGAGLKLIDARGGKQFQDEHIKGAISIPANAVNSETLSEIAPDVNTKLVFYCTDHQCAASKIAARKALGAGYKYVYHYMNGIVEWKKLGYQTEKSTK